MIVGGSLCRALLELGESPITNGDGDCGGGGDVDMSHCQMLGKFEYGLPAKMLTPCRMH